MERVVDRETRRGALEAKRRYLTAKGRKPGRKQGRQSKKVGRAADSAAPSLQAPLWRPI